MSIPRRSERKTKGIPPERYEDAPDNLKQATESRESTHPSCTRTHDKSISRVESIIEFEAKALRNTIRRSKKISRNRKKESRNRC
ncbi:hypothetical protein JTB14_032303 [Gonioctena quinquepunctata]|nr:hypothetical protein JTB14_032303 [Gonioctena quinquepunctata]